MEFLYHYECLIIKQVFETTNPAGGGLEIILSLFVGRLSCERAKEPLIVVTLTCNRADSRASNSLREQPRLWKTTLFTLVVTTTPENELDWWDSCSS